MGWTVATNRTLALSCKQTRRAKLFPLGISGHRRVMSSAQSDWSSSNLCLLPGYLSLAESSLLSPWLFGSDGSPKRTIESRRVALSFHNTNWKYWKQCNVGVKWNRTICSAVVSCLTFLRPKIKWKKLSYIVYIRENTSFCQDAQLQILEVLFYHLVALAFQVNFSVKLLDLHTNKMYQ